MPISTGDGPAGAARAWLAGESLRRDRQLAAGAGPRASAQTFVFDFGDLRRCAGF